MSQTLPVTENVLELQTLLSCTKGLCHQANNIPRSLRMLNKPSAKSPAAVFWILLFYLIFVGVVISQGLLQPPTDFEFTL